MRATATIARQSRQVTANQQGLNKQESERDDSGESGQDVDRTAPFELRARRSDGDWRADGDCEGAPDQGRPGQFHSLTLPALSDRLQDEMRLQAGFLRAPHDGAKEHSLEFTAVIGEVPMRLTEDGNDLRHLEAELPILVRERGSV